MTVTIKVSDPLEIRRIGLKALNKALGVEGTKIFIRQYSVGTGNYTKEKYEMPEQPIEKIAEALQKIDFEEGYAQNADAERN